MRNPRAVVQISPAPGVVPADRRRIGRGRSGEVFLDTSTYPLPAAAKAFTGDRLADLVHLILGGAPNPYRWCEDAVWAAFWRRRIVADLVRYWLPDQLEVAEPLGVVWNSELRAWELHARFAEAYATALHHPFSATRDGEQRALQNEVMQPLQRHLREAGFDGLLWQAGLGNPVAANNFLVNERRRHGRTEPGPRWTWIDLESGVPALFPLDPRPLLAFYVPRSSRHRRPLFDDVDLAQLERYLERHRADLAERLGAEAPERLQRAATHLARHQERWHARGRTRAGVEAALALGTIDPQQADHYLRHPARWQLHQARELARTGVGAFAALPAAVWRRVRRLLTPWLARSAVRFVLSQSHRSRVARLYVLGRIRHWRRRRQITPLEAGWLRRVARRDDQAAYLSDLAVHLAIKPLYKGGAVLGLPLLAQAGMIPLWGVALGLLLAGPTCRSLYTAARVVQNRLHSRPAPWAALAVGLLPIVGTAAFPVQIAG